jgi:hypothetical protein
MARSLPERGGPEIVSLSCKYKTRLERLSRKNALAYLAPSPITKKKSFIY